MTDISKITLYSGGHKGTEAEFGKLAEAWNMEEVNISFEGHNAERTRGVKVLSQEELKKGDVSMEIYRLFAVGLGAAVFVGVGEFCHLAELCDRERAVTPRHAEYFVLPAGEELVARLRWCFEGAGDEVDVTTARADGEAPVGEKLETAGAHRHLMRDRDVDQPVVFLFLLSGTPHRA